MLAAATWLRSEARGRWPSWLASVVLVGFFGGVVLAAAAGARRTDTAYARLLRESRAADAFVSPFERLLRGSYDEIRRLPQVADAGMVGVPLFAAPAPSGAPNFLVFCMASADGRYGYTIHRPNVLEGRLPHPERATEALVDPRTARTLGVSTGSELTMRAFSEPPADPENVQPGEGTPVTFTVVGIGVFPDQIVPTQALEEFPRLFLPPAAYRLYGASPESIVYEEIFVRLKPGADVHAFRTEVDRITAADPVAGGHDFSTAADRTATVERAIRPQASALALFAMLAGVTGLLVVGQTLGRQIYVESGEYPTLRALGMTRGDLLAMTVTRIAGIASCGAVLAALIAVAASALMPVGPARLAEPDPGLSVNVALLSAGVAGLVILVVAATAWPAWRAASQAAGVAGAETRGGDRPSRLVAALSRTGAPVAAVAGVRLAVERSRGRAAVPVRTTLGPPSIALLAVVAALIFGANLDRLVSEPERYGKSWDVAVDGGYTMLPTAPIVARLSGDPTVVAFSGGTPGEIVIGGRQVAAVGIDRLRGDVFPTLLEGRAPAAPDEIVLGTKVLRRLDRSIGDRIDVGVGGSQRDMRIVGRAVFPAMGLPGHQHTGLGEGALLTGGVLPPVSAPADAENAYSFFLVRFGEGAAEEGSRLLEAETQGDGAFGPPCNSNAGACVLPQRPGDIANYARVRATPLALAAVLIVLGLAATAHALVSSFHRRRRDLAVLKALGLVRRQVAATVTWQATAIAAVTVAIGVPLGTVAGRWAWSVFAHQLGVASDSVVPLGALVLTVPAALALANLVSLPVARAAGGTSPAAVLRSE